MAEIRQNTSPAADDSMQNTADIAAETPAVNPEDDPAGVSADRPAVYSRKREHRGRVLQVGIYLRKLLRMFVYQNEWKTFPMAALVAGTVALVIRGSMFVTMEGTIRGSFAIACVCLWNGCFNSIQVICRERDIIKREHRSGMHISSYIVSHMIYQAILCLLQTGLTLYIFRMMQMKIPTEGMFFPLMIMDLAVTIFLITYASDITSLFISCVVHNTTTAMTVMPFMLIFQLVFSGGAFTLSGPAAWMTNLTISKYGLVALCAQGNYNSLKSVLLWNTIFRVRESSPELKEALRQIEKAGMLEDILARSGEAMQETAYEMTKSNIFSCWAHLILFTVIFAVLCVIVLEFIDNDRR